MAKTEECDQKVWNVFDKFAITIACSATYFLEVGACVSLKVATKASIEVKKTLKIRILGCFSKVKAEKCDSEVWKFFDQFGINIPCSATFCLEVGTRIWLKVATKGSIRGKIKFRNLEFLVVFL